MGIDEIISEKPTTAFMLCNEAIVRAALESDVKVYAAYPGSPTAEIVDTFYALRHKVDMRIDISSNEKVALETVAGAAMAGLRGMTSMKSVGLNVASDTFYTLGYVGIKGGLLLIVADDPHAHSSQSEQDGRYFAPSAYIPMLEPSDPTDAMKMVRYGFDLSEKFQTPVMLRTVTRVNHQSGLVRTGEMKRTPFQKADWPHEPARFVTVAESARNFKLNMLERSKAIKEEFENSELNTKSIGKSPGIGVITSSAGYNYAVEACRLLDVSPSILKLGTTSPLPERLIADFIAPLKRVILVEELSPYLEMQVAAIAKEANPGIEIIGKRSGHLSEAFEYNTNIVAKVLSKLFGVKTPRDYDAVISRAQKLKQGIPIRPPTFCPGCPHRGTFNALRKALKGVKHVFASDIGCYSMSTLSPNFYGDSMLCMGASVGIAAGFFYSVNEKVIAMIGDSTFFHAGMPGLVNALHNGVDYKLIILDNDVTAMTGQQPHPGTPLPKDEPGLKRIVLEEVVRGMGVDDVTIVDPYDVKNSSDIMKEALARPGLGVIISRRVCALHGDRLKRRRGEPIISEYVDKEVCKRIYACEKDFYCPAISIDEEDRRAIISRELCDGCMVCAKLCPIGAIKSTEGAK